MKEKNITISDIGLEGTKKKPVVPENKTNKKKKTTKSGSRSAIEKNKLILIILIVIIGFAIGGFLIYSVIAYSPTETSKLINYDEGFLKVGDTKKTTLKNYRLPEPSEPRTKINPINGNLLTSTEFNEYSKRIPVAVMVNNHAAARPQANLSKADVVYEALAESGITRYMPIYWQNAVTKVGPIRSVRQYYLEWLSEYDAVFIHDGYASGEDPKIDAGGNMYRYNIKTISTQGAWRESSRVAPHNEYSSVANALNIAEKRDWFGLPTNFESWKFKNDAPKNERGNTASVSIEPHSGIRNGGLYDSTWVYDKDSNVYLRYIANTPDMDEVTGTQVMAKVVILQETKMTPTYNEKAHIIIETQGTGKATILMDGKVVDSTWKKESRTKRTKFYDSDDNEIQFNRGQIWIISIAKDVGSFDIIEQ